MGHEDFKQLTYKEFRKRLQDFGLHESKVTDKARTFYRMVMGLGQPFISVPYRGDDGPVYPEEIDHMVTAMGVPRDMWIGLDEEKKRATGSGK